MPHRGKRAIDADHGISFRSSLTLFCFEIGDRFGQIDIGATMIEVDPHVRITLRGFNYSRVERRASDRVDAFFRIDIVRREMQITRFIVNHPAPHRDRVPEHLIGDAELLKRVNSARRKREIDRAPADNVAFAWISPPFVKIDIVSTPPQVRCE